MEGLLKELVGKKIDVNCGSNVAYRGEVISSDGGVLKLINEEGQDVYVAIDKIAAVSECKDFGSRPGFIV
jgi:phage terminase large subunit